MPIHRQIRLAALFALLLFVSVIGAGWSYLRDAIGYEAARASAAALVFCGFVFGLFIYVAWRRMPEE